MKFRTIATLAALAVCLSAAQAAPLIHDYQLNGSLADSMAGPSLVAAGGVLGTNGYTFGANQGLSLSNGLVDNGSYSIELQFSFANVSGYRKVLDFKDRSSDVGFYVLNSTLNFYPIAFPGGSPFSANTLADVILTRDAGTGLTEGYVNGIQYFGFTDSGGSAIFDAANNIIQFFNDDNRTSGEASAGCVRRIRVFDGALNANEITDAQAPLATSCGQTTDVPEPGSLALLGLGLVALSLRRRNVR